MDIPSTDEMKGKWKQHIGAAKIAWGRLTEDELLEIEGHAQKLSGLVVTPGNVLFATIRAELKGGAPDHLRKLADFLNRHPDRTAIIEDHTDNVGSEESNRRLSQRRADAVKSYLVSQNVNPSRITA